MKHIKTFESFSPVKEEFGYSDIKAWVKNNVEAIKGVADALAASTNPEVKAILAKIETLPQEEKEKAVEATEDVAEVATNENFLKKAVGNTMTWLGKLSQYGAGAGLVYQLGKVMLADEGLMDKVQAYHTGGISVGLFVAYCCAALVGGLIVSKIGQAIRK